MKKVLLLSAFLITQLALAQSELIYGIPRELKDSVSPKFSSYIVYEVNNMDGRIVRNKDDECKDTFYAAFVFIPLDTLSSMLAIKRNLCHKSEAVIKKEAWDFYRKNKEVLKREKIKSNIEYLHQKRQRLLFYENNKLTLEIFLSEEYLKDENKFKKHNLGLLQVKLLSILDNEIENVYK